jgi:hypothetical protein
MIFKKKNEKKNIIYIMRNNIKQEIEKYKEELINTLGEERFNKLILTRAIEFQLLKIKAKTDPESKKRLDRYNEIKNNYFTNKYKTDENFRNYYIERARKTFNEKK